MAISSESGVRVGGKWGPPKSNTQTLELMYVQNPDILSKILVLGFVILTDVYLDNFYGDQTNRLWLPDSRFGVRTH